VETVDCNDLDLQCRWKRIYRQKEYGIESNHKIGVEEFQRKKFMEGI
jgi:hypothetical protein